MSERKYRVRYKMQVTKYQQTGPATMDHVLVTETFHTDWDADIDRVMGLREKLLLYKEGVLEAQVEQWITKD